MAVIPSVPGVKVTIQVDGATAQEYESLDDETQSLNLDDFHLPLNHDQNPPYVVKYIEAKPEASYEFHLVKDADFRGRSHHIAYRCEYDGEKLGLMHEKPGSQHRRWASHTNGLHTGNPTDGYRSHRFRFAALSIVETDRISAKDLQEQMSLTKNCGILRVSLFSMRKSGFETGLDVSSDRSHRTSPNTKSIVEKALKGKAVDSFTTYTSQPRLPPSPRPKNKYSDARKRPFAIFEFRYRFKEGLIKEGIISRPNIQDELLGLNEAQLRQRLTQLMERNERSDSVGVNEGDQAEDTKRGIKREAKPLTDDQFMARYKSRRLDDGGIEVDLCGVKRENMADDDFLARYRGRRLENGSIEVDLTDD